MKWGRGAEEVCVRLARGEYESVQILVVPLRQGFCLRRGSQCRSRRRAEGIAQQMAHEFKLGNGVQFGNYFTTSLASCRGPFWYNTQQ